MVVVNDCDLRVAAGEGAAAFLDVVIGAVRDAVGGEPTAEAMAGLNGWQNTLLAYATLRDEVMEGGFVQLVQNGYGPYIFMNPFAKACA